MGFLVVVYQYDRRYKKADIKMLLMYIFKFLFISPEPRVVWAFIVTLYMIKVFLDHLSQRLNWAFMIEKCLPSICMRETFHIFNFFCIATAYPTTKLTTTVPLGILKKYCIFLMQLEIQDGSPSFWLAETLLTSSPELLHVKSADLQELFV